MSHCFFEPERFDEVRFDGNWVFARVGRGYVGIYSQNGMVVGDEGQYAGRELICTRAGEHLAGRVRARGRLGIVRRLCCMR